jgi:hypothetical protein
MHDVPRKRSEGIEKTRRDLRYGNTQLAHRLVNRELPLLSWRTVQSSETFRKRNALLSQEGSAARRVARGEVPEPKLVGMRLWNLLSRDLDCVSITVSS